MQDKFCHFGKVDVSKYNELWHMQQQEACGLVRQLLAADRVIHEQQLGWQWQPPDDSLFMSPHDVVQANTGSAAAAAAAGSSCGTRTCSVSGGASPADSRQVSSGGSIVLGPGSPKVSLSGSVQRVSGAGARSGSSTSGAGGSTRGTSSGGGARSDLQLHSPPEVRAEHTLQCTHTEEQCTTGR